MEVQCLVTDFCVPEATTAPLKERASMCIKVTAHVLILCVSATCPGVLVNEHAICTVTLTLVNCETNSRQRVGLIRCEILLAAVL